VEVILLALNADGRLRHVQSKALISDEELDRIQNAMKIERHDLVVVSAGLEKAACTVLGKYVCFSHSICIFLIQ
jgi:hypothetical protein